MQEAVDRLGACTSDVEPQVSTCVHARPGQGRNMTATGHRTTTMGGQGQGQQAIKHTRCSYLKASAGVSVEVWLTVTWLFLA